jgi:hypothetical protein
MTIGLIVFYFVAAFIDFWGFTLGTLPLISGLITLIYGVSTGLTKGESTQLFVDSDQTSGLLTAGSAATIFGLGVETINIPIQLILALFGGISIHDI